MTIYTLMGVGYAASVIFNGLCTLTLCRRALARKGDSC